MGGADNLGYSFKYPTTTRLIGMRFERLQNILLEYSLVSPIGQSSTYCWLLALMLLYAWVYKSKAAAIILCYPVLMVLTVFLGPCNGHYIRYIYPIISTLPFLILMVYYSANHSPYSPHEKDSDSHSVL